VNRILIVEDEPRIAAFVEKGLKANGFATTVSRGGREGLRLERTGSFDLVILDLGLPDVDGLEVLEDLRTRQVTADGHRVELTAREFALAEMFFRHPGQVLSREQLLSHVWGYDYDRNSNVLDVYVGYLRRKLGKERIASVRGLGYRLDAAAAARP
jgi:DNA-binding response OmpR family regulator